MFQHPILKTVLHHSFFSLTQWLETVSEATSLVAYLYLTGHDFIHIMVYTYDVNNKWKVTNTFSCVWAVDTSDHGYCAILIICISLGFTLGSGLHGPCCPLSEKGPLNFITHKLTGLWFFWICFTDPAYRSRQCHYRNVVESLRLHDLDQLRIQALESWPGGSTCH